MFERYKCRKLEKKRYETLSAVRGEELDFEEMLQRPREPGDDVPDEAFSWRMHEFGVPGRDRTRYISALGFGGLPELRVDFEPTIPTHDSHVYHDFSRT
jgi:hypothetical protein